MHGSCHADTNRGWTDPRILRENWVGWYVRIASDRRDFVVVCGERARFYWVCLATPNTDTLTHVHKGIRASVQQTVTKWNSIHVWMLFFLCFDHSAPVLAFSVGTEADIFLAGSCLVAFRFTQLHLVSAAGPTWNAWWRWSTRVCWREG